jgi:hypothetical protein
VTEPGEQPAPGPEEPLRCPRCGSAAEPGQEYCLECGARMPAPVKPPRPAPLRRIGAGARDALVTVVAAFVVALLAVAGVLAVQAASDDSEAGLLIATAPRGTPPLETEPVETALPPEEPEQPEEPQQPEEEPPQPAAPQALISWPAGTDGWTVVLASIPTGGGRPTATARAREARDAGLGDVGILVSANFSSLHPGYFVVFSGVHTTQAEAEANVAAARSAGYDAAYARRVTP